MALKDVLAKFRSISRPSLLGGSNSAYSSLVKKTQAAEDAIIDNQYESGNLSPEYYLSKLQERIARGTITPLQKVNLTQKMQDVQVAVNDADVARRYANKEITTEQVLGYEKSKLAGMTEKGSAAYIKQQQKVQGLVDKAEKEARNNFRISENLRISRLPEDTSANLWEKAKLYQTLSDQARLDGDIQQADTLLASANTYTNSAKKADVNDMITSARMSVSQTPTQGLGVPSAAGATSSMGGSTNGSGATVGGGLPGFTSGTTPSAVDTTNTGITTTQTPAIKNALTSLDRQQKTYERLNGQKQDNETMVQRYKAAVNAATGDQKTALQISLNNLIDAGKGIDNQIANTEQNISDTYARIQELQQSAALSQVKQETRVKLNEITKNETELDKAFKTGKINKDEYISKGLGLAQDRYTVETRASDTFGQYGEDDLSQKYLDDSAKTEEKYNNLGSTGQFVVDQNGNPISDVNGIKQFKVSQDYEPIAVDPGGKVTSLTGSIIKSGEAVLTNVRQLKDNGTFERQYVAKDGKYFKVHFPSDITDSKGDLLPAYLNEDLSKYSDKSFIYQTDANGDVIGKDNPDSQIKFVILNGVQKPINTTLFNKIQNIGGIVQDKSGSWVEAPKPKDPGLLMQIAAKAQGFVQNMFTSDRTGTMPTPNDVMNLKNKIPGVVNNVKDFVNKSVASMNVFNPPSAKATNGTSDQLAVAVPEQFQQWVIDAAKQNGIPVNIFAAQLAKENMNWNPAVLSGKLKSPAGAIGAGQFMPETAKSEGVDPYDVKSSIFGAAKYMNKKLQEFDGDIEKALASYNAGSGAVRKYGGIPPFKETQNYVKDIMAKAGSVSIFKNANNNGINVKAKDYTDYSAIPDPKRTANVALALGMQPGTYRSDLKNTVPQEAIDRGFRGDTTTQQLLRSEGLKPSWETKSVSAPMASSQPIASSSGQLRSSQPSSNIGQSISSGLGSISNSINNTYNKVSSGVKNVVSKISSAPIFQPKLVSPIPEPPKPQNIIQKAASSVSNFVGNAVNKLKGLFKW